MTVEGSCAAGRVEWERPPGPGELAKDVDDDRVGVVVLASPASVQLRPLGGGALWEADAAAVRPLTTGEQLTARRALTDRARGWAAVDPD